MWRDVSRVVYLCRPACVPVWDENHEEDTVLRRLDGSGGGVLGYEVGGRLTEEEFGAISEELKAVVSEHGGVRLLVRIAGVPRMELGALAEDLKLVPYAKDVERYAIVSDSTAIEWAEKIGDLSIGGELRHFEGSRCEEAWRWLGP